MSNVGVSVTLGLDELLEVEKLADEEGVTRSRMIARLIRIGIGIVNVENKKRGEK